MKAPLAGPAGVLGPRSAGRTPIRSRAVWPVPAAVLVAAFALGPAGLVAEAGAGVKALQGRQWTATHIRGVAQVLPSATTATFGAEGRLGGNAGAITIDPRIVVTEMAGLPELMAQEQACLEALPRAATWAIEEGELWLRDADGAPLARFAAP